MNYNIVLDTINAEKACPPQADGELNSEWLARVEVSRGKSVVHVVAAKEGDSKGFEIYSPFFNTGNSMEAGHCMGIALGKIAAEIMRAEYPEKPSKLSLNTAENQRYLNSRKRT